MFLNTYALLIAAFFSQFPLLLWSVIAIQFLQFGVNMKHVPLIRSCWFVNWFVSWFAYWFARWFACWFVSWFTIQEVHFMFQCLDALKFKQKFNFSLFAIGVNDKLTYVSSDSWRSSAFGFPSKKFFKSLIVLKKIQTNFKFRWFFFFDEIPLKIDRVDWIDTIILTLQLTPPLLYSYKKLIPPKINWIVSKHLNK